MSALQAAAQGTVEQIALSLAGGTAIAAIAWLALRLSARPSSRARFATWFGVLVSIASLPVFAALGTRVLGSNVSGATPHAWITIPESWATYLFLVWIVIVCAGVARLIAGLWQVHRVRASCEEIPASDLPLSVRQSLASSATRRAARICVSDDVRVPTAIGFFRPTVVIPRWLFGELPDSELNQVVLHELTHLARWDDWTNLAQKTIRALLFFHPAVWWIDHQLSLEREMACDDAVIAATENPHSYARCLAMLAEKSLGRRGAALAQAAVHKMHQVTARVIRILEPSRTSAGAGWAYVLTTVAALGVGGVVAVNGSSSLIAFRPAMVRVVHAPLQAARPKASPDFKVVPAAMHISNPTAAPVKTVRHKTIKAPNIQPRVLANLRTPQQSAQQNASAHIIPAKAVVDGPSVQPSFVILTIFSGSQSDVQYWELTVYVPAPQQATAATPRHTT